MCSLLLSRPHSFDNLNKFRFYFGVFEKWALVQQFSFFFFFSWKDYSNTYLWWGFSCLYSLMYPFSSPFFLLTLLSSSSLTQTNSLHEGSRRRQKGSDYTSTSDDDEYDSKQSTPKNKRSQPSSAFHSPRSQPRPRPQPMVALHPKHSSKDLEENKPEGETLDNWSNHSAEIAR